MIALIAGDDVAPLRLSDLKEILAGELDRRFVGFRSAGEEIDPLQSLRREANQGLGQLLRRLRCEEGGVRVGHAVQLPLDRIDHRPGRVAKAGDRRAAAGIQIALAAGIDDAAALAGNRQGQRRLRVAREDVGGAHGIVTSKLHPSVAV